MEGAETSGRTSGEDGPTDSLPLAEARLLVARSEGFAGWVDLMAELGRKNGT